MSDDEVVGLYDDTHQTIDFSDTNVPVTPYEAIASRGGNNPDGLFTLFVELQ